MNISLKKVDNPVIGKRYHLRWANNPYMTWILISVGIDWKVRLKSKTGIIETTIWDLRERVYTSIKHYKNSKQLEITFLNRLER